MGITVDGKLILKKKYFDLLFQYLCDNELLSTRRQNKWRMDFQKYFDRMEIDRGILSEVKHWYGVGLQNVFLTNCKKGVLLCENFGADQDKGRIRTSVCFSGLGCLLDYLLDFGNKGQKAEAEWKLNWDYCKDYFLSYTPAKGNSPIDLLYETVSVGMGEIAAGYPDNFETVIALVRQAIDAELAVRDDVSREAADDIILDKSVLFIMAATEILLAGKTNGKEEDRRLIRRLGYAYALIDDLCDLYEDQESGQQNLFLKHMSMSDSGNDMEKVIRYAVFELREQLKIMEENFDRPLYDFILQEIREWGMSNEEIRNRVWDIYG